MALRALIIANESFEDPEIPPLSSPVSDGHRLKALLEREDVGGYQVELCDNASSIDARHAVQQFFDSGAPGDLQLLVLSGHGLKDRWSRLYFATSDTVKARLAASSLEARFVRERMDDGRAGRKILIIDACYSGAFLDGMVPKKAGDLEIVREDFGNQPTRGVSIVTASTAVQLAGEKDVGGAVQSVFTRLMIEGIETGAADAGGEGMITLADLFDHVSRRMRVEAPGQTPQCLDLSQGGSMMIARNPVWRSATLPDDLIARIASRDRNVRVIAVEDLARIVQDGGAAAPKAVDALRALAQDDSVAVNQFAQAMLVQLDLAGRSGGGGGSEGNGGINERPEPGWWARLVDRVARSGRTTRLIAGAVVAAVLLAIILLTRPPGPATGNLAARCESGEGGACTTLAAGLNKPDASAEDLASALELYRKACDGGNIRGCANAGYMFTQGKGAEKSDVNAVDYYVKGCDGNEPTACTNLGLFYENARGGLAMDLERAAQLYGKGCDAGSGYGCYYLANLHYNGQGGLTKDVNRIAQLNSKACDANIAAACTTIGLNYETGDSSLGRDLSKANMLYRKGCDGEDVRGCAYLGQNLFAALGIAKDDVESRRLLDKACKAGNDYGCTRLKENFPAPAPSSSMIGNASALLFR